jgi:hypothetical protein
MKILFINIYMHKKNADSLFKYNNEYCVVNSIDYVDKNILENFDCVYSPGVPIDVSKYPGIKFIFGPHFSVFPENHHMNMISGKNTIYIQPSEWSAKVWENNPICSSIKIKKLPFGVDTDKFINTKPINERNNVFIYFKHRNPKELEVLCNFLENIKIPYIIFSYENRYNEPDYISYLQNSKFGLWLDGHESQGFALEEALSCDVPLLVWNVSSMKQEYGSTYDDIPASTIPYWDERCGEFFYNIGEFEDSLNKFISKIESYKPREYILENLSIKKCEEKLYNLINSF